MSLLPLYRAYRARAYALYRHYPSSSVMPSFANDDKRLRMTDR